MHFALVDNNRVEASPNLKGLCPYCMQDVIAKCGTQKIWHWAHRNKMTCDNWWEPETEWHRTWKNNYPADWQEISLLDERTGEKHIADVRTAHNLVIEFQHSHIDPQERTSRENFYRNMVWVVDGARLKRDYPRFLREKKEFRKTEKPGIFLVNFPNECFPSTWLESSVPIIFDYKGSETIENKNDVRNHLYCLLPIRKRGVAIVAQIPRKAFIDTSINGDWSLRVSSFIEKLIYPKQEQKNEILPQQQQTRMSPVRYRQRRGSLIDYIEKKHISASYKPKQKRLSSYKPTRKGRR